SARDGRRECKIDVPGAGNREIVSRVVLQYQSGSNQPRNRSANREDVAASDLNVGDVGKGGAAAAGDAAVLGWSGRLCLHRNLISSTAGDGGLKRESAC